MKSTCFFLPRGLVSHSLCPPQPVLSGAEHYQVRRFAEDLQTDLPGPGLQCSDGASQEQALRYGTKGGTRGAGRPILTAVSGTSGTC